MYDFQQDWEYLKFHRSGPAIIFSFWTIMEHVSYPSRKLPINPRYTRTSSRCDAYYSRNDYEWFLKSLLIFHFCYIGLFRTRKNFQFLEFHRMWHLSIKKALNQPYQFHGTLNMVLTTLGSSMDGFQQAWQFLFFIIFHISILDCKWVIQHQSTQ